MLHVMDDGRNAATEEERLEFRQSVRTSKQLDALISELISTIAENPEDIDSRLVLAQALVAKVWGSASSTPEQRLLAGKAEAMWKECWSKIPPTGALKEISHSHTATIQVSPIRQGRPSASMKRRLSSRKGLARRAQAKRESTSIFLKNGDSGSSSVPFQKGVAAHPEDSNLAEQLEVSASSYKFE